MEVLDADLEQIKNRFTDNNSRWQHKDGDDGDGDGDSGNKGNDEDDTDRRKERGERE